jgi:citrate synthase
MGTEEETTASGDGLATAAETLTITDNRTGRTYEVPIEDGTIRALSLRDIKVDDDDFGLMTYDPAFMNTASCRSAVTYIDGDKGVLEYRGYPIEQLAEQSTYLEVAYLLVHGELPTQAQLDEWTHEVTIHTFVHENVKKFMEGYRYDAHPMGMLLSSVGALSTFYPDASQIKDPEIRYSHVIRLIAKMPTLAAFAYRHNMGQPYVYPDNDLRYPGNFLNMLYKMTELKYQPDPRLERALDILFILHADHEQNCSTSAVRSVGSSQVDPYSATAAGVAALYGPLHGGANEAVLRMLRRIETTDNIPDFMQGVKDGKERLMGFGHRVYKNYDPRAKIIKKATDEVFEVTGTNPLLDIALELERIALEDDYFVSRKLYPNVDFYSGLIYEALGMPVGMFPVLFAIPRTSGWIAQWLEMIDDSEQKIARPRQIYTGERERDYVPILAAKPRFTASELRYLTEVDGVNHIALVAVLDDWPEQLVAVARCVRLPDRPDTAEMAIVVGDPFQGQGVGRAITNALADAAIEAGIRRFAATMAGDNVAARRLMQTFERRLDEAYVGSGLREVLVDLTA